MKIISGAQTGADRSALVWAKRSGIPTGGWMPAGFRAEDGKHPEYAREYGIKCTSDWRYPPRTELNVKESAATFIFGDIESAGCSLTRTLCIKHRKPYFYVPFPAADPDRYGRMVEYAGDLGWGKVVNVAGNREEKNPGIGAFVESYLDLWYTVMKAKHGDRACSNPIQ